MKKLLVLIMTILLTTVALSGCLQGDDGDGDGVEPMDHAEFMGDAEVRRALNYLFDYQTAREDIYNGFLSPLPGPIPAGFPCYDVQNDGEPMYSYDPAQAEQILQDAGYEKTDGQYFGGATVQIYFNSGNTEREQMARDFAGNLRDAGINAEAQGENWAQYLDRMFGSQNWDIMFLGWAPDYIDPDNYFYNFAASAGIGGDVWNTGYQNDQVDALLEEARFTQDIDERCNLYEQAYDIFMEEPNEIHIGQNQAPVAMRDWVQDFVYHPSYGAFGKLYDKQKADGANSPNTFTWFTIPGPRNLDPADAWDSASNDVQRQVYEGLVTYEGSDAQNLQPALATEVPTVENGGITNDGSTYTFQLREGVTYHNGNPFNATDVEMHFKRVLEFGSPSSGVVSLITPFLNASGVEATGSHEVRFDLHQGSPLFLRAIAYSVGFITDWETCQANGGMPTKNATGAVTDNGCSDYFKENAVGTGAYELDQFDLAGGDTVFVRNDDYWRGWEGDHVDQGVIQYSEEANTRILALENGDVDMATVPTDRVSELQDAEGVTVEVYDTFNVVLALLQTQSTVEES